MGTWHDVPRSFQTIPLETTWFKGVFWIRLRLSCCPNGKPPKNITIQSIVPEKNRLLSHSSGLILLCPFPRNVISIESRLTWSIKPTTKTMATQLMISAWFWMTNSWLKNGGFLFFWFLIGFIAIVAFMWNKLKKIWDELLELTAHFDNKIFWQMNRKGQPWKWTGRRLKSFVVTWSCCLCYLGFW